MIKIEPAFTEDTLRRVLKDEPLTEAALADGLARGTLIVLENVKRRGAVRPVAVGRGTRTKVNANFGTSRDASCMGEEKKKLDVAVAAGADAVMDLSTGADMREMLKMVLEESPVPVGTVPVYGLASQAAAEGRGIASLGAEDFLREVEYHCEAGVDFITVHCGLTRECVRHLEAEGRVTGIVSRGGAITRRWIKATGGENPLYEHYDEVLKLARKYNVALSLGDGLRPGSVADATDRAQIGELLVLGELVDRARAAGVSAMVEGPGHVPLNQVELNIKLQKELCKGAPFYVLGPLVTDIAPGYDHITCAIGGALAGMAGADFLCYVTPAEHLRLPTLEDVRLGVITTRIAAHAADLAKGLPGAAEWDLAMSTARKALDWDGMLRLAIDPETARRMHAERPSADPSVCTMCSELCAMKD